LFTLGLGLTTTFSLDILVLNIYQTFAIVSIEFWLGYEPKIHSTRFTKFFLFIIVRVEKKVHLCVKLLNFFRG